MASFIVSVLMYVLLFSVTILGVMAALWGFGILRVITIEAGTAVVFKDRGRYAYCAMEFPGYHFDADGSIEPGDGRKDFMGCWAVFRIGGWVFYLWPFVKPAMYSDTNDPDNFGDGYYVRLGDRTSEPSAISAETGGGQNLGITVQATSVLRVRNVMKYLIRAPRDVKKQVIARLDALLRSWIKLGDDDHAQAAKGDGVAVWEEIVDPSKVDGLPVINTIRNDWGMEIVPNSIIVRDVGYDKDYQEALKATSQADLLAKAKAASVGGPINLLMEKWIKGRAKSKKAADIEAARSAAKADGSWDTQLMLYKDLLLADSGNLQIDRIEVGTPSGQPLGDGDKLIAMATALRGPGKRGGNTRSNRGQAGGKASEPNDGSQHSQDDLEAELRRRGGNV